jgi:hypothetical protein
MMISPPTTTSIPARTTTPPPIPTAAPAAPTPLIIRVGGSGDFKSIQAAIDTAEPSTTIQVAQGTYRENILIRRPVDIKLQGGWNADFSSRADNNTLTVIDGGGNNSVLEFGASDNVKTIMSMDGFTFRNGQAKDGAGIHVVSYGVTTRIEITLNNDSIIENTSSFYGGGISIVAMGGSVIDATLTDCAVLNNTAETIAGGIHINTTAGGTADVKLLKNTIKGNLSRTLDAGGVGVYASGNGTTLVSLTNNLIIDNQAVYGGGLLGYPWGKQGTIDISMTNNIIAGNRAKVGSGFLSCSGTTGPDLLESGGKITWALTNNTITGNYASEGDAIQIHSGSPYGDGGDIFLNMRNDIVWGNSSPKNGPQISVIVATGKAGAAVANIFYSDVGPIATWGTGALTVINVLNEDPLFLDAENRDFSLQDDSPCIDMGDPAAPYNDGRLPPAKGAARSDIGAYGGPQNFDWPMQ